MVCTQSCVSVCGMAWPECVQFRSEEEFTLRGELAQALSGPGLCGGVKNDSFFIPPRVLPSPVP